MGKLKTPDWILQGKEKTSSKLGQSKEKKKGKTFKLRVCPKCGRTSVSVVLLGEEGRKADEWECKKCGWSGKNIKIQELSEGEFLKMGEEK